MRLRVAAVLASLLCLTVFPCHGDEAGDVLKVLKRTFPKMTVNTIALSPIKGMYEVVSGGNIFYFDPAGRNLIFGEVWSETGKNLTAEARSNTQLKNSGCSKTVISPHPQERPRRRSPSYAAQGSDEDGGEKAVFQQTAKARNRMADGMESNSAPSKIESEKGDTDE